MTHITRMHKHEDDIMINQIATKYPVFKDEKKLWQFDYEKEEKKRFRGEVMRDPSFYPPA